MSKRRIRWIGAGVVVAAAITGGVVLAVARQQPETAAVSTATVDRGEVTVDVASTGTVEPVTTRDLTFAVDGTVASVAVRAGNRVKAGQTLAALDSTGAIENVTGARAALAEAQARLAGARTATVCAADAATPACALPGTLNTGADQMLSAELAANRAAEAVEDAEDALAGVTIKAPIAGTVVSVAAGVGDQVRAGSTVISLADTSAPRVRANFPEADAGALARGQRATVSLTGSAETIDATVAQVDPVGTADGTLVRYGVLLSLTGTPEDLLLGQSAQVRVRTGEVTSAVRVPSTAVRDGIVLVRTGNRSEQRPVAVGLRGDQYTEITDGLAEGEQIVRSW